MRIAGTGFVPGADEGIDAGVGTDMAWEMGVWEEVFPGPCAYLEVPVAAGNNPFPVPTLLFILSLSLLPCSLVRMVIYILVNIKAMKCVQRIFIS